MAKFLMGVLCDASNFPRGGEQQFVKLFMLPLLKQPHTGIPLAVLRSLNGSAPQQLNLTLFNNNGHNLHNEQ